MNNLLLFLQKVSLFKALSKEELEALLPYFEEKKYEFGQFVFVEGETGRDLFIVKEGKGEILKKADLEGVFDQFSVLGEGDIVGEMGYFENEKRSASFRAIEPLKVLIFKLEQVALNPNLTKVHDHIIGGLARHLSMRLRKTDETLVARLVEKLSLLRAHDHIGITIVYIFILTVVYFDFLSVLNYYFGDHPLLKQLLYSFAIPIFASGCLWIILKSKYPLRFYGLTLEGWKQQILEGVLLSIPIVLAMMGIKQWLIATVPHLQGETLWAPMDLHSLTPWGSMAFYVLFVPLQEFIARGFLQSSFVEFFQSKHRVFFAILVSNLFFDLLHTSRNLWLGLAVFLIGIGWGYLYQRHRSIVGVSVSHAIVGTFTFFFLDYLTLFSKLV